MSYEGLAAGTYRATALQRIVFGRPATEVIKEEVEAAGAERVFILTSRSMSGEGALPARVAAALGSSYAGTFGRVSAHAPREDVLAAASAARELGADLLISIGGGSVSDATKYALLCLWEGITTLEDFDKRISELPLVPDPSRESEGAGRTRMFAVPTMLSAGEFTWFAGVTDTTRHLKHVTHHALYSPAVVVLDPAATFEVPVELLQSSGMKAVDHAIEFICAPGIDPLTEAMAGTALRLLHENLPKLGSSGDDYKLRMELLIAAWLSIWSVTTGIPVGAAHAIGHALGALGVAHGDTTGVVEPAILRWNEPVNGAEQARAAALCGRAGVPLPEVIHDLAKRLGRPTTLTELRISRDQAEFIADASMKDAMISLNPREISAASDVIEILQTAW